MLTVHAFEVLAPGRLLPGSDGYLKVGEALRGRLPDGLRFAKWKREVGVTLELRTGKNLNVIKDGLVGKMTNSGRPRSNQAGYCWFGAEGARGKHAPGH